jgi:hypothetical protein
MPRYSRHASTMVVSHPSGVLEQQCATAWQQ